MPVRREANALWVVIATTPVCRVLGVLVTVLGDGMMLFVDDVGALDGGGKELGRCRELSHVLVIVLDVKFRVVEELRLAELAVRSAILLAVLAGARVEFWKPETAKVVFALAMSP